MTTIEELTSWRVAAITGQLPEPARSDRWQPQRAGVVNLWEYDAAEVWYADGRMQLQGANESGKSTLMTLTTLLLLTGDISGHNIDTLGQSDKHFRFYVEPTEHALDRRDDTAQKSRGWAWLEFGNGTDFFTLLLFAEARRADARLKVDWCTVSGQIRVRSGLSLTTAGLVADPTRFKDVAGFVTHPSGTAYRETIARTLYGTDEAWLNQLNRILRVVRTPQIGHKIDLKFLTEAFRTALPPIAEDEINQLADGWEQLQRLRDERDEADQALAAVTEFSRRHWRPWADAVIRAASDPVTAVTSALTQITREEKSASEKVDSLSADMTTLNGQRITEDEARLTAIAKREALEENEAYQDALAALANARQLEEQASRAEAIADRSDQRARTALDAVEPAELKLKSAEEKLDSAERTVATVSAKVTAQAREAGLTELTARYLPELDTARLRQAVRLRVTAAEKAVELIDAYSKALSDADAAAVKVREARTRLGTAQRVAAERELAVEDAITGVAESLSTWARGLDEPIRPSAELLENWSGLVSGLAESPAPAPLLSAALGRDHLIPVRRPYDQRLAGLNRDLTVNATEREALQLQLDSVEAERDPSPRDPEFWIRRQRPEGVTTAGAPFWRLVETMDGAPAAELEAALDAAGLLQAWVSPDGAYLNGREGSETVWSATTGATQESSLRAVLRPADDCGDLTDVVERLLGSVAYDEEGLPAGNTALVADGRWRHGELTGLATPSEDAPRLLGAAGRSADRERRSTLLRARLTDLTDEYELLSLELEEVTRLLSALDTASDHLPTDTGVVSAVLLARDAAERVEDAAAEAESVEEAERDARSAVDAAAADASGHCGEYGLPLARAEVDAVMRAVSGYESLLGSLDAALSLIEPLRDTAGQAAQTLAGFRETADTASQDADNDRTEAVSLRAKSNAAKAALTQGAQEILLEVNQLRQRIKAADGTLKRLATEAETIGKQLSRAEAFLEQAEAKRKTAEAERESAVVRWWGCVDTGLPRLRGVPDPAARHVTAALETARAARSAISIRDWPDDQHLTAQRVQNRWSDMIRSGSDLRSKLELLGGRGIRFISPGEGRDDFPGGVELMVDGTGAALAPPTAADRLSSLLIRLQEDYDEELTKTIDNLLGSTFIEHLRDRLAEAEALRGDINAKLAQNPTAVSGITLRLQRLPASEERAANDVLAALERDFELLPKPTQERIRTFLADRVTSAQEEARASGDPEWRSRLALILDYRRWFDLRLEYRTPQSGVSSRPGGGWRTLDRGDHGLLSGGAKVVTLMQPFVAALHAMYDQAGLGPRMLWLDEAFGGVDATNKASMFRLLAACDLDWLIAGPGVIANSAAVPLAAIYEVRRAPQPLPGVSLELAVWTGNELTHVLTPDPADLRDLTVDDERRDEDALFPDL